MNPLVRLSVCLVLAFGLAAGFVGCGGKSPSPKADATELEQAFGLKSGGAPSDETSPAGLAARALDAMRAEDWPTAMAFLERLRRSRPLTPDQSRAVHNASANLYVRLAELAARGDPKAQQTLEALKKLNQ